MIELSQFDIDEIIGYCDLKTKSRLNVIMKNIVVVTTITEHTQPLHFVFEHCGLTIFLESKKNKYKFRLDREHGYERMIESIYYTKCNFKYNIHYLHKYLNAILSILSNNPFDLKTFIEIENKHIGIGFNYGKTIYGGDVYRYIGSVLVNT